MNETRFWSAPGSLLLAGEYLVTEEGGQGLALAAGGRGTLKITPGSNGITAESIRLNSRTEWTPRLREGANNLFDIVYRLLYEEAAAPALPNRHLTVDTSSMFYSDGTKKGFSSSALSSLLISRGMLNQASDTDKEALPPLALRAHRIFQNGRGSGYDIYCSYHGGFGIFTGGEKPHWERLSWPAEIQAWVIRGKHSVSTPHAVRRYEEWKTNQPGLYSSFRREYNEALNSFIRNLHTYRFFTHLKKLSELGIKLGELTGVPSRPRLPAGFPEDIAENQRPRTAVKCAGAGDETALLLSRPDSLTREEYSFLGECEKNGIAMRLTMEHAGLCPQQNKE